MKITMLQLQALLQIAMSSKEGQILQTNPTTRPALDPQGSHSKLTAPSQRQHSTMSQRDPQLSKLSMVTSHCPKPWRRSGGSREAKWEAGGAGRRSGEVGRRGRRSGKQEGEEGGGAGGRRGRQRGRAKREAEREAGGGEGGGRREGREGGEGGGREGKPLGHF